MRLIVTISAVLAVFILMTGVSPAYSIDEPNLNEFRGQEISDSPILKSPSISQKDEGFSGYYVFDGKMFYYDQESGALSPLDKEGRIETPVAQEEEYAPSPRELLNELPKDDFRDFQRRPVNLAHIAREAQAQGLDDSYCKEWGSPFLQSKTFSSKQECDNALEIALDQALVDVDKYVDSFEKYKRAMQLDAEFEEYKKISKHKLDFTQAKQILTQSYRRGCGCLEDQP